MHYFYMYIIAIDYFIYLRVKKELNKTLYLYTIRLLRLSIIYRFEYILTYYLVFIITRI